jgi:hypothetical protein
MAKKRRSKAPRRKKSIGGLAGFQRKVKADPSVRAANRRVTKLESDLSKAKKKKQSARKKAIAKIRKKSKK